MYIGVDSVIRSRRDAVQNHHSFCDLGMVVNLLGGSHF